MRTKTFKSVLYGVMTRLGLDPTRDLQVNSAAAVAEYLQEAVRHAWESDLWPEWTLGETRTPVSGVIALAQPGETLIGECLGVWTANPESDTSACQLRYILRADGIHVRELGSATTVWVEFSPPPPQYSAYQWVTTTPYDVGDVVYDRGECYLAIQAGAGNVTTDAAYWTLQPVPYVLSECVKHAALASAWREDGQYDKALQEEVLAQTILESEQDKIILKQHQHRRFTVRSRR